MADPNDIPKAAKLFGVFWPALLALLVSGASVAQTTSKVGEIDRRLDVFETSGSPATRERLGRIETSQTLMMKQLDRMEQKIDDLDKRTRDQNLRGL